MPSSCQKIIISTVMNYMTAKSLLDTNLWVYLYAKDPPDKTAQVRRLVDSHFDTIVMSTQILGELYHVLTRKNFTTVADAKTIIQELATNFPVVEIDVLRVLQALEINTRYQYSYWDSLIISTALLSDCRNLYSEDMQHQQIIDGQLHILSPFE